MPNMLRLRAYRDVFAGHRASLSYRAEPLSSEPWRTSTNGNDPRPKCLHESSKEAPFQEEPIARNYKEEHGGDNAPTLHANPLLGLLSFKD
jgi:hypothetical protein